MPEADRCTIPIPRRGKGPQKTQLEAEAPSLSLPAALIHSKHPRALLHELHLLNQLLYKSHAQLRSAKWVQSVRAVRKCGKRIFGDAGREDPDGEQGGERRSKRRRLMEDSGGGESKVGNAGTTSKSEILSSSSSSNTAGGVFGKVQTRATALGIAGSDKNVAASAAATAADSSNHSSSSASAGVIRLRSAEMDGETAAAWQGRRERARQGRRGRGGGGGGGSGDLRASVTDLISLLRHLVERCNASYAIISAHLRTPPAPFLAPLATALLGVCAQCGTTASAWADDLERINWERDRDPNAAGSV